jgi:crossover junction endodeoxyribonuclease RuvC
MVAHPSAARGAFGRAETPSARGLKGPERRDTRRAMMRVFGIDPGIRSLGWAVVTREQGRYRLIAADAVRPDPDAPMPERLRTLHASLSAMLTLHQPDAIGIEAIFSHRSATSALVLGQARGVALLAAAQSGVPVFEYNASTIKSSVGGSGKADKGAMGRMVEMLVGQPIPGPHDTADAVAIAITHLAHAGRPVLPTRATRPALPTSRRTG